MRIIILFLFVVAIDNNAISQTPKKKVASDNRAAPSNKNEIRSQMNEATDGLKKELADLKKQLKETTDPQEKESLQEQISMLEKQLKMMQGLNKNVSMMSDKIIQQATQEETTNAVPEKDVARINMVPEKILTDAELVSYLKNVISEVENKISPQEKEIAKKLQAGIINKENYNKSLANVASTCWMNGYTGVAIYLMGKVCIADMNNGNNLNNYAAFLTMCGADHAALPILQNLNKKYPENNTILNNIGQAWYGLGDMNKAKQYLDNSMHFYGLHSQAYQTMCMIQESEGKKEEAIESIKKSIQENYTPEKEARLNELGGKLAYDDIPFRYPTKRQPLGIENIMIAIPAYPFASGVESEISRMEWEDFREKVFGAVEKIKEEKLIIEKNVESYRNRLLQNPQILIPYNNPVYKTAARKMALLHEWYVDRIVALSKKMDAAKDTIKIWEDDLNKAINALGYDPQNPNANCGPVRSLTTTFLRNANTLWQQRNAELLSLLKQKANAEANLSLYGTHDVSLYQLAIANIKLDYLIFLGNLHCEFNFGCMQAEAQKPPGKVLPDFDSVNCHYKDSFSIGYFTRFNFECNKMKTKFHLGIDFNYGLEVTPYVDITFQENLINNTTIIPSHVIKSVIEIGAEIGADKLLQQGGIYEAEAKIEGAIGVEFEHGHLEGAFVKAGAKVDAGPSVEGHGEISNYQNVAGVETEIKWVAGNEKVGSSIEGKFETKGFLKGIHLSTGATH